MGSETSPTSGKMTSETWGLRSGGFLVGRWPSLSGGLEKIQYAKVCPGDESHSHLAAIDARVASLQDGNTTPTK